MSSAYTYQLHNVRRTWLLIFLFTGLTSAVFYIFGAYYGNPGFAFFGLGISLFQAAVAYFSGDKIALSYARAQKVSAEKAPQIHAMVENLSKIADIPKPEIYVSPDESANAFATGRNPENGKICLNQGILRLLNKSELEGVIAHEISHIKNRDILVMTVTMVMSSAIAFIADLGFRLQFWGFGGRGRDRDNNSPLIAIIFIVTLLLAPFVSMLIQFAISRKREYLADATAATMTRYPDGLKNALLKLYRNPTPATYYSTSMNHFYITPSKQTWGQKIQGLFSTHPTVQDRVKALNNMGASRRTSDENL